MLDVRAKAEGRKLRFAYLMVRVGQENARSLRLFKSLGFEVFGEGINYFGEVEMRLEGLSTLERVEGWMQASYQKVRRETKE